MFPVLLSQQSSVTCTHVLCCHMKRVVYNICNSVPRGTTYLAGNLPHPATVPAEPLMSVYNYVSGHHVVIFVTLVCTLYLKYV